MNRVGLVELWDADYGIEAVAGAFTSWRGRLGNVFRPEANGSALSISTALFSNSRKCVLFNGTTTGLRASIPSLRRACGNLAVHVHAYVSLNSAVAQTLIRIHNDGANTRLYMNHPAVVNLLQSEGIDNSVVVNSSVWAVGEGLYSAARSISGFLQQWKNGVSAGSLADSTSSLNNTMDVSVGFNGLGGDWFSGGIRRIAVYTALHDTTAVAALDAQWRGY